jgi:hypothetical protein
MNRAPLQMTPTEIITELDGLRRELDQRLARVHGLAEGLYHQVRRAAVDDNTPIYITYANAWMRFAGMANQGVVRTASASKVLRRLTTPEQQEAKQAEVRKKKPDLKAKQTQEQSPMDSLIEMYRDPISNEGAPADSSSDDASSSDAASVES